MKTLRLLVMVVVAVLVLSVWVPAPVYAKAPELSTAGTFQTVLAVEKTATLTVDNRTGGTLWVRLSGPKSYWFSAPKAGKTTFKNIAYGKYTITVSTSACGGSMTYTRNIKGNLNLKGFICRK